MDSLNLFKYYKPKHEGEDNLSFHKDKSIYFQKPSNFNDPWDCKAPQIIIPEQLDLLKDFWFYLAEKRDPSIAQLTWNEIIKLPHPEIIQFFDKQLNESHEALRSKMGVFSLSFIPDSELMWSHYTSSHSGYMLHFQINIDQFLANSRLKDEMTIIPVKYRSNREVWSLDNYRTNKLEYYYDTIRIKSIAWAYECELRLLNTYQHGFIKIPSNWLKSIVIGIDTGSELQNKLNHIGSSLNISVFSSEMNKEEYKIDIPGLGINGDDGRRFYEEAVKMEIFNLS